jgi:hypothetical protein
MEHWAFVLCKFILPSKVHQLMKAKDEKCFTYVIETSYIMTQFLILGLDIIQVKHFHLELLKTIKHFFLAKTKIIRHLPKRFIMAKAPFELE